MEIYKKRTPKNIAFSVNNMSFTECLQLFAWKMYVKTAYPLLCCIVYIPWVIIYAFGVVCPSLFGWNWVDSVITGQVQERASNY